MINLRDSSLVVIDVETSGVNPFRNEILAVGLVPLLDNAPPLEVYIRPNAIEWSAYARENFQKYAAKWETCAVTPPIACDAIEKYVLNNFSSNQVTPIGHNIGFDISFLKKLAFLGGRDELAVLSHRAIDTHTMLYVLYLQDKLPQSALSSDGAFRYFGIRVADSARHTAIGDALATRELMLRLLDLLEVGISPIPESNLTAVRK